MEVLKIKMLEETKRVEVCLMVFQRRKGIVLGLGQWETTILYPDRMTNGPDPSRMDRWVTPPDKNTKPDEVTNEDGEAQNEQEKKVVTNSS